MAKLKDIGKEGVIVLHPRSADLMKPRKSLYKDLLGKLGLWVLFDELADAEVKRRGLSYQGWSNEIARIRARIKKELILKHIHGKL